MYTISEKVICYYYLENNIVIQELCISCVLRDIPIVNIQHFTIFLILGIVLCKKEIERLNRDLS